VSIFFLIYVGIFLIYVSNLKNIVETYASGVYSEGFFERNINVQLELNLMTGSGTAFSKIFKLFACTAVRDKNSPTPVKVSLNYNSMWNVYSFLIYKSRTDSVIL
jgi:hypothetical protein